MPAKYLGNKKITAEDITYKVEHPGIHYFELDESAFIFKLRKAVDENDNSTYAWYIDLMPVGKGITFNSVEEAEDWLWDTLSIGIE